MTKADEIVVQVLDDQQLNALGFPVLLNKDSSAASVFRFLDPVQHPDDLNLDEAHLIICDLRLGPGVSGLDVITRLVHRGIPVVATSGVVRHTANIADAIGNGASAFLSKDGVLTPELLRRILFAVHSGRRIITAALALELQRDADTRRLPQAYELTSEARTWLRNILISADSVDSFERQLHPDGVRINSHIWRTCAERTKRHAFELTSGELDVVRLMNNGMTYAQVARELGIKETTVKDRLSKLRDRWVQSPVDRPVPPMQGGLIRLLYRNYVDRYGGDD